MKNSLEAVCIALTLPILASCTLQEEERGALGLLGAMADYKRVNAKTPKQAGAAAGISHLAWGEYGRRNQIDAARAGRTDITINVGGRVQQSETFTLINLGTGERKVLPENHWDYTDEWLMEHYPKGYKITSCDSEGNSIVREWVPKN